MTVYESIYPGADNTLTPKYYASTEYRMGAGEFGMPLDPRTANQLGELNTKINPGMKHIEVSGLSGATMESIPEQHLDEMRRSSKITGVTLSFHGPLVEASGIGERGWDEVSRLGAEKQLESAMLRTHKLDPKGNISFTVHTTAQLPEMETKIKVGKEEKTKGLYIIQPDTGKIHILGEEKRYFPIEGEGKGEFTGKPSEFNPQRELEKINRDQWDSELANVNIGSTRGEEILTHIPKALGIKREQLSEIKEMNIDLIKDEKDKEMMKIAQRDLNHGEIYLRDAYRGLKNIFDKAYANVENEKDKEKLEEFAKEVQKYIKIGIEKDPIKLGEVVEKGIKVLGEIKAPNLWKPLEGFAIDKTSETFSNVAISAYKKFGETSPILNIENPPAGGGLSRAEDLKKVIEETRDKFVEKLVDEGYSKGEARKASEKLIGATWDVGHINMLRKKGYSEQDIVEQTKIIAPFVKHVHLSDNFGLDHTELPMGMGNVPIKEIMKKLGEKGFEGKKIIEAGNWWQYFADKGGGNPFRPSIEAFDSPLYSMKASPYWSNTGGFGSYYMGHGAVNPAVHHRIYGSGFEALPMELGGEIPGDRSRLSGTPNQ